MAKMERERAVKEKRARKQERKDEKKAAREAGLLDPELSQVEDEGEAPTELE
jgi:hypothetical protein